MFGMAASGDESLVGQAEVDVLVVADVKGCLPIQGRVTTKM